MGMFPREGGQMISHMWPDDIMGHNANFWVHSLGFRGGRLGLAFRVEAKTLV